MTAIALPSPRGLTGRSALFWPLAALAVVIALQFPQVFLRAINWDEFWHYSQIHQLQAGTFTRVLQSIHTRMYGWATALPGSGIDHIIAIRLVMLGYELLTAAAIAGMAARFSDRATGLVCALGYLAFPYVFQHGYAFRYDPPAAALLMSSLWLLLCRRLDTVTILACGALLGLAAMVSIKIVLYAPAFAGVLWLRWNEAGRSSAWLLRMAGIGLATLATFTLLYLWHRQGIVGDTTAQGESFLSRSGSRMLALEEKPYWIFALRALAVGPATAALVLLAPWAIWHRPGASAERLALAGLFLPLTSLLFYHNTAPYYYAFMLAPVMVAASQAVPLVTARFGMTALCAFLAGTAAITLATEPSSPINSQRQILAAADRMFPQGARYFDFPGMLGRHSKANPFMSIVVTRDYLDKGTPVMLQAMQQAPVPLAVENDQVMTLVLGTRDPVPMWLPQDVAALRSSYIRFWGPLWVAGQAIPAGSSDHAFNVLVPGPYTVEGNGVILDGTAYDKGAVVNLDRGLHVVSGARRSAMRLVWGDHLPKPDGPPPAKPYYLEF